MKDNPTSTASKSPSSPEYWLKLPKPNCSMMMPANNPAVAPAPAPTDPVAGETDGKWRGPDHTVPGGIGIMADDWLAAAYALAGVYAVKFVIG